MWHHLTLPEFILWFLDTVLRFLLLLQLIRWRIHFPYKLFHIYVLMTLLYGVGMFPIAIWLRPSTYFYTYWASQTIIYILHMCVGLTLLYQNGGKAWLLRGSAAVLFLVLFLHYWHQTDWSEWQKMVMWSDSAVMVTLVWTLMRRELWDHVSVGIGLGLAVGTILHLCLSMLQGDAAPVLWIRLGYQLASISSLSVWLDTTQRYTRRYLWWQTTTSTLS